MPEIITTFLEGIKIAIVDTLWPLLIGTIPGNIALGVAGFGLIAWIISIIRR